MSEGNRKSPELGRDAGPAAQPEVQPDKIERPESEAAFFAAALHADAARREKLTDETRQTVLEAFRRKFNSSKLTVGLLVGAALGQLSAQYERLSFEVRWAADEMAENAKKKAGEAVQGIGEGISLVGADDLGYALERTGREMIKGEGFDDRYATITDNPVFDVETAERLAQQRAKVAINYTTHAAGYSDIHHEVYVGGADQLAEKHRLRTTEQAMPRSVYAEYDLSMERFNQGAFKSKAVDKYGNEINAYVASKIFRSPETGQECVRIQAVVDLDAEDAIFGPLAQGEAFGQEAPYSVSVDLTAVGGPEMKRLVEGWALRPVLGLDALGKAKYPLYVTAERELQRLDHAFTMDDEAGLELGSELAATELLFGLKPGDAVKRVVLTGEAGEGQHINATYSERTVTLPVEWVPAGALSAEHGDPDEPPVYASKFIQTARHEALHAVDHYLGLSDKMKELHRHTTLGLFRAIDESQFLYAGKSSGGHSAENPRELFATLYSGIMATNEQWEAGVARMKPDIQDQYKELLDKVRSALAEDLNEPQAKEARFWIDERRAGMEKIIQARQGLASAE